MLGPLLVLLLLVGAAAYLITALDPKDDVMPRTEVTADELYLHWMSPEAVGLTDDHQTRTRVVRLADGTEYETPFADVRAQQARQAEK